MICLDSSAWIEHFTGGPLGDQVRKAIKHGQDIVVPSVCFVEVGAFLNRRIGKEKAAEYLAAMRRYESLDLDRELALETLEILLTHQLPMADSIIYASARKAGATLITLDNDFRGLAGVKFISK